MNGRGIECSGRSLALLLIFSLTATPQSVLKINIVEGEGAVNNIQQRVAREPIVQVTDEDDRPVEGAIVVFTLPERGPSGTFADGSRLFSAATDKEGRVTGRGFHPNSVTGQFEVVVTASSQGRMATRRFGMSNVKTAAAAAGGGGGGKLALILAIVGGAAAAGVAVAAGGGGGSSTAQPGGPSGPTAPPAIVISPGSGSVGPP